MHDKNFYPIRVFSKHTLHHEDTFENGTESWNMLSSDNLDIAYGVYLYHIDAPGIGEHTGKFAVIK